MTYIVISYKDNHNFRWENDLKNTKIGKQCRRYNLWGREVTDLTNANVYHILILNCTIEELATAINGTKIYYRVIDDNGLLIDKNTRDEVLDVTNLESRYLLQEIKTVTKKRKLSDDDIKPTSQTPEFEEAKNPSTLISCAKRNDLDGLKRSINSKAHEADIEGNSLYYALSFGYDSCVNELISTSMKIKARHYFAASLSPDNRPKSKDTSSFYKKLRGKELSNSGVGLPVPFNADELKPTTVFPEAIINGDVAKLNEEFNKLRDRHGNLSISAQALSDYLFYAISSSHILMARFLLTEYAYLEPRHFYAAGIGKSEKDAVRMYKLLKHYEITLANLDGKTPHEKLGVNENAPASIVTKAFVRLAMIARGDQQYGGVTFYAISEAKKAMLSDVKRNALESFFTADENRLFPVVEKRNIDSLFDAIKMHDDEAFLAAITQTNINLNQEYELSAEEITYLIDNPTPRGGRVTDSKLFQKLTPLFLAVLYKNDYAYKRLLGKNANVRARTASGTDLAAFMREFGSDHNDHLTLEDRFPDLTFDRHIPVVKHQKQSAPRLLPPAAFTTSSSTSQSSTRMWDRSTSNPPPKKAMQVDEQTRKAFLIDIDNIKTGSVKSKSRIQNCPDIIDKALNEMAELSGKLSAWENDQTTISPEDITKAEKYKTICALVEQYIVAPAQSAMLAEDLKKQCICPLTQKIMRDPVMIIATSQTFERMAIIRSLEKERACPVSEKLLSTTASILELITDNLALRKVIEIISPISKSEIVSELEELLVKKQGQSYCA
jgi:hypothetical protein